MVSRASGPLTILKNKILFGSKNPYFLWKIYQNDRINHILRPIRQFMPLKDAEEKLLSLLKQRGREPITSLADELGVARATVSEMMIRLEKRGLIRRYTIDIDAKSMGYELRAFIFARCERGDVDRREVAQKICLLPYVVRCNVIAGEWDLLIEVVSTTMNSLGDAILDEVSKIGGISSTHTMVSFYDFEGVASSLC